MKQIENTPFAMPQKRWLDPLQHYSALRDDSCKKYLMLFFLCISNIFRTFVPIWNATPNRYEIYVIA